MSLPKSKKHQKNKALTPQVTVEASCWTGLWAMEQQALRNLAANGPKAQAVDQEQKYTSTGPVAVIPIVGPIAKYPTVLQQVFGGVSTLEVMAQIDEAIQDDEIERIILYIDSPGGTVAGTGDLAAHIASAKQVKPIIAYISDHCFSAAYWIASQCSKIIANEGAFVGSIGVYSVLVDSSQAAEAAGVQLTLIAAGEYKGLEEPGLPIDQKAIGETYRQVQSAYDLFTSAVESGRNLPANIVKQLADGRIHVAREAQQLKLIDAIGPLAMAQQIEVNSMSPTDKKPYDPETNPEKKADASEDTAQEESQDELLKQVLSAISALAQKIAALTQDDEQEDNAEDDSEDSEAKKAVAAERTRLQAIHEACGGRSDFALKSFLDGKSAVEAKAALADVLNAENALLKKQAASDGAEPLALNGPADSEASNDPEVVWKRNVNNVQKAYSGKKEYFLAAWKHNNKQLSRTK